MEKYILTVLFLILALWGAKPVRSAGELHADYLSIDASKSLRGLFAFIVLYHHLGQNTVSGCIAQTIINGGYLAVAGFFFFSGYGIQKQYLARFSYRKDLLLLRIPTMLILYAVLTAIYWAVNALTGTVYSLSDIFLAIAHGTPIVSFSWYILNILVFYFTFWVLAVICREKYNRMILLGAILYLVWTAFCLMRGIGAWYYNTMHLAVLGMFWAVHEKKILQVVKKYYYWILPGILIPFIVFFQFKMEIVEKVDIPGIYQILEFATTLLAVLSVLLITMKVQIGNRLLRFFGDISLELYLIQGAVFIVLDGFRRRAGSEVLYCLVFIGILIVVSWLLHLLFKKITGMYKKAYLAARS